MPLYKAIVSIPMDTSLPKDRIQLTPWFSSAAPPADLNALAQEIGQVFVKTSTGFIASDGDFTCTLYEKKIGIEETGPPVGSFRPSGKSPVSCIGPREIALCLSFYAGTNRPRNRGRLYLPAVARTLASDWQALRPPVNIRNAAMNVATGLAACGGSSVNWCVYSRVDDDYHTVTNAWCDDEWDTQRPRGLSATTRTQAAVAG